MAEIKRELPKLTAAELLELEDALELAKACAQPSDYLGCLRGAVIFKPGWDEDEPFEAWEALRDDPSA